MSWTAYDDPVVARKMTSLALQELGRWLIEPEFHEPWNVFLKWMERIRPTLGMRPRLMDVGCASGYYGVLLRLRYGDSVSYCGCERSEALRDFSRTVFGHNWHDTWAPQSDGRISFGPENPNYDIVLSGSMLQHEQDWEQSLTAQVYACRRWLIIHKIPTADALGQRQKQAYGVTMNEWNFPVWLINEKVGRKPVDEHWFASVEPHWSGLYDLGGVQS